MHGYEIKRYLEITRSDQWAGILVGSIYHAIKRLESEGMIAKRALEHVGNRDTGRLQDHPGRRGEVSAAEIARGDPKR